MPHATSSGLDWPYTLHPQRKRSWRLQPSEKSLAGSACGTEPTPLTVPALLANGVQEFGDRDYLVTPTERLTYSAADRLSAGFARWLLAQGVGKGSRVGLFFANGAEWVTGWLAVSRVGAIAVPLSTMYRPAEIAKVVRLADVGLLIAPARVLDIEVAERLEAPSRSCPGTPAGRLALRSAPFLRRIVFNGDDGPKALRAWVIDGAH